MKYYYKVPQPMPNVKWSGIELIHDTDCSGDNRLIDYSDEYKEEEE